MAFLARGVFGSFEKRTPVQVGNGLMLFQYTSFQVYDASNSLYSRFMCA